MAEAVNYALAQFKAPFCAEGASANISQEGTDMLLVQLGTGRETNIRNWSDIKDEISIRHSFQGN